ncbi:class I histocompatibility antigen, F10 alpha chain-like [Scyliorhinus canicula]|uniref:class I histocompatibility antigen, F10 alpha chain-like n=1 Tax=Scyliorhinus canicula TaxID=7830 RepID=UPI0018F46D41|nr:class I histocompatibility antigen, F10 alpha chain-like [Scyliorhinus canicula]
MHRDEKDAEMYSSGVRPNHDGTFQMEKHTDYDAVSAKYSCKVAHSGLTEPMILFYEPKADSTVPVIVGIVIAVLVLIALAIVGVVIYKRKRGRRLATIQQRLLIKVIPHQTLQPMPLPKVLSCVAVTFHGVQSMISEWR